MERRSGMPELGKIQPDEVLDELAGPRMDWQKMVRTYPLTSLIAATMGGLYLGKRYGWQMINDLSAFAADELVRNVQAASIPIPSREVSPVGTVGLMAKHLLHISDVHFGPPHRPEVAAGVLRLIDERKPSVVVLSGDLTQRAKPAQFQQARQFVDQISVPVIAVPGNHDVPLYRVLERLFRPYGAYQRFFSEDLEPVLELDDLALLGINTAHGMTLKDGRISLKRLDEVISYFRALPEETYKVVVAHHQLIPPPSFVTQRVLHRAYESVEAFSEAGVDLVLSGHMHQAYLASSEEFYPRGARPFLIVHSGTTTSSRGRGVERGKNTCNWISIEPGSFHVSQLLWDSEAEEFVGQRETTVFRREVG